MRVRNLVEGKWNFEHTRRQQCPPWGLWGGKPGEFGDYLMRLPGENDFKSMAGSHVPVPVRAEVVVRTGGGGGWGDPLERDPAAVRNDVLEEFVTVASAREDYGVVLRDDLTLDEAATATLRRGIKARS
jgi:N-methylhydantoinase B